MLNEYFKLTILCAGTIIAFAACVQLRGTPQKYPYAFDLVPDEKLVLFDEHGKKLQSVYDRFPDCWEKVRTCIFDGKSLNLERFRSSEYSNTSKALKPITLDCLPYLLALPVAGQSQRVIPGGCSILPDGEVLILGGSILPAGQKYLHPAWKEHGIKGDIPCPLKTTWIFNPITGRIKTGPEMKFGHRGSRLTHLQDSRILITGGWTGGPSEYSQKAEIYDPRSNSFTALSDMRRPRHEHSVVQLENDKVLLVGGKTPGSISDAGFSMTSTAEILDLTSGKFVLIGQLHQARVDALLVPLGNNKILVCGGESDESTSSHRSGNPITEAELYSGRTNLEKDVTSIRN